MSYMHDIALSKDARDKALRPLLHRLEEVDDMVLSLMSGAISSWTMSQLKRLLKQPIVLSCGSIRQEVALEKPKELRQSLRELDWRVHFHVKSVRNFPVYYIFRKGGWDLPVVLEDLYLSEKFPFRDERYLKYRDYGRTRLALRLGQYRESVRKRVKNQSGEKMEKRVDEQLEKTSRLLNYLHHEDQYFLEKMHILGGDFEIPHSRNLVKVLYALLFKCWEGIGRYDEDTAAFFEQDYGNHVIANFLEKLFEVDEEKRQQMHLLARDFYPEFLGVLEDTLSMPVQVNRFGKTVLMKEFLMAHYWRLEQMKEYMGVDSFRKFTEALPDMEAKAKEMLGNLVAEDG